VTIRLAALALLTTIPACASSGPSVPVTGGASSVGVSAIQPVSVPLETKGKRFAVTLPVEFSPEKVGGVQRDAQGDGLLVTATRAGGYRIQVFYDPDVPVANEQIQEFGGYLVATAPRNLPHLRLGSSGVVSDTSVSIFFVSYMLVDGSAMGTMLIRSLSGSPLRVTIQGPRTPEAEPILAEATKHMMGVLGAADLR
jgi:hypothetical protein